jgi:hypothetical protein
MPVYRLFHRSAGNDFKSAGKYSLSTGVHAMYRLIIALAAGLSGLFLILTCGDSPTDPFSPENAAISLLLKSSTFQESDTAVSGVGATASVFTEKSLLPCRPKHDGLHVRNPCPAGVFLQCLIPAQSRT